MILIKKKLLILLSVIMLFTYACQKEDFSVDDLDIENFSKSDNLKEESKEIGDKLERAVSLALKDGRFAARLVLMTQEMRTGDFEVLLTDFLDFTFQDKTSIKSILLKKAKGLIEIEELEIFMRQNPSMIIATRGSIASWLDEQHTPAVIYLPPHFKESSKSIEGKLEGKSVNVDLSTSFKDVVIAIHKSERHDDFGNNLTLKSNESIKSPKIQSPKQDLSLRSSSSVLMNGNELTTCPEQAPVINSFEVTPVNGGMLINYDISNFGRNIIWSRIRITRTGLNETREIFHDATNSTVNFFYDPYPTDLNTTYYYTINAYLAFKSDELGTSESGWWVTCPAENNFQTVSATGAGLGPRVSSFVGRNLNSRQIQYSWYEPNDSPVIQKYRLQVLNQNGNYETVVDNLPSTSTTYTYNYPYYKKGERIQMRIQYYNGIGWTGDFFDHTYGSFRDPGEPLYFYGMKLEDSGGGTTNESPAMGAPEFGIIAGHGLGAGQLTHELQNDIAYMRYCVITRTYEIRNGFWSWLFGDGRITVKIPTDILRVHNGPKTIISSWDNFLLNSAIKIKMSEIDSPEERAVRRTEASTNQGSVNLSGRYGFKEEVDEQGNSASGGTGISAGFTTSWNNSETIYYEYPDPILSAGTIEIMYHFERLFVQDRMLFGYLGSYYENNLGPQANCTAVDLYVE